VPYNTSLSNIFWICLVALLLITSFNDIVPGVFSLAVFGSLTFAIYKFCHGEHPAVLTVIVSLGIALVMAIGLLVNYQLGLSFGTILRSTSTLVLMFLSYWGVFKAGESLAKSNIILPNVSLLSITIIAFELLFEFFNNPSFLFNYNQRLSGFFFTEPSHLALTVGGLFIPALFLKPKSILLYFACATILLLSPSAVLIAMLVVGVICWLVISSKTSHLIIVPVIACLFLFVFSFTPYYDAFQHRLESFGAIESRNISTVVYMNGYQLAERYLFDTSGFGIGLNLMGELSSAAQTPGSLELLHRVNFILNFNDGSFLASKLISELGVLGIFILAGILSYGFAMLVYARKFLKCNVDQNIRFKMVFVVITYNVCSASFFLRSAGYFEPNVLLAFLSVGVYLAVRHSPKHG